MVDDCGRNLFEHNGRAQAAHAAVDWSATPLGPVAGWSEELCAALRTVMPSRVPMLIWWGLRMTQLYNDAFTPLIGDKHPQAMGQDAADCYPESWAELGPLARSVLAGEGATYSRDLCLPYRRHGYVEETYWTFSYSPIRVGQGVGGIFVAALETTAQVLAERRLRVLQELGGIAAVELRTVGDACLMACTVLDRARADVAFAMVHLLDDTGTRLALTASSGLTEQARSAVAVLGPESREWRVVSSGRMEVVTGLGERLTGGVDRSVMGDEIDRAVVLPLTDRVREHAVGSIVLGLSPHRAFDADYRSFVELVARQMSTAATGALAYAAERERAEALAALARAKTRFLQNVSHEFRTPLTLILGPLTALRDDPAVSLFPHHREGTVAALRAARRLERLVDSLLRFAGADGEPQVRRESTDVADLTTECASMFRAAIERAGLRLVLDLASSGPVELDQEMWLTIVSNLLSNAVKFTPAGTITVRLRQRSRGLVLEVADTGIGIPAGEVPRVFDRFHQVPGTVSRSGDGVGIGLALVADLAGVLGGGAAVDSTFGSGSTFTVTVAAPPASAPARSTAASVAVRSLAAEAASWVEAGVTPVPDPPAPAPGSARILLVEDNADLRGYLTRLLRDDGWTVVAVPDAESALEAARHADLVLSDVMMPGVDGLELVRRLRGAGATARVPVVLLTARAGSESAAEGLRAGADDYVIKPFDPAELLARVRVHVELSRLREFALAQAERRAANLEVALGSNRQIGAAIGILMQRHKITERQGLDLLRRSSQAANRKLRDIADTVVLTGELPEHAPVRSPDPLR
jgi:signal transduction histidine kinase/DNA-binding response OmpR family regulator